MNAAAIVTEMLDEPAHGAFATQPKPERSGVNWNKVDWRLSDWRLARHLGVTPGVVKANRENHAFNLWLGQKFSKPFPYKSGGKAWGIIRGKH